jgi:hypothetical protein
MSNDKDPKLENPLTQCPYCQSPYETERINQIKAKKRSTFVHAKCRECQNAMMLHIRYRKEGLECAGILTDWSASDARRFLEGDKVSVDDVIEMHEACSLDNFPHLG